MVKYSKMIFSGVLFILIILSIIFIKGFLTEDINSSVIYGTWKKSNGCRIIINENTFTDICNNQSVEYKIKKKRWIKYKDNSDNMCKKGECIYFRIILDEKEYEVIFPYGKDISSFILVNVETNKIEEYDALLEDE